MFKIQVFPFRNQRNIFLLHVFNYNILSTTIYGILKRISEHRLNITSYDLCDISRVIQHHIWAIAKVANKINGNKIQLGYTLCSQSVIAHILPPNQLRIALIYHLLLLNIEKPVQKTKIFSFRCQHFYSPQQFLLDICAEMAECKTISQYYTSHTTPCSVQDETWPICLCPTIHLSFSTGH